MVRVLAGLVLSVILAALPSYVRADSYPSKPVVLVAPFAPGGAGDNAARVLAQRLGQRLGKPVIVDNRPGGQTIIGTGSVARAEPDGHTLLLITDFFSINEVTGIKLPYDGAKAFKYVARVVQLPLALVTSSASNIRTLDELIERAKKEPGKLNFASLGPNSPHSLALTQLQRAASIEMEDIHYTGAAKAYTDLLAGAVDVSWASIHTAKDLGEQGKLFVLGVTSENRQAAVPNVPSISERLKGFVVNHWYGIAVPAGTSDNIITTLNKEFNAIISEPDTIQKMAGIGTYASTTVRVDEFEAFVRQDIENYRLLVNTLREKN